VVGIGEGTSPEDNTQLTPACKVDMWDVLRTHYPHKVCLCELTLSGMLCVDIMWDVMQTYFQVPATILALQDLHDQVYALFLVYLFKCDSNTHQGPPHKVYVCVCMH